MSENIDVKILSEDDLLNQDKRGLLIKAWNEPKNTRRKDEAFKAYECLKDKTVVYVLDHLLKQFELSTVAEMQYAMSNISILRKVIDKLAKVYAQGVKRTMPVKESEKALEDLAKLLKTNSVMKKANRYFRTFKNTLIYIRPQPVDDKFEIIQEVKAPFNYDVVCDPHNKTQALAIILSDYSPKRQNLYALGDPAFAGRSLGTVQTVVPPITPYDPNYTPENDKRIYVWWTKSYHFSTDAKGAIVDTDYNTDSYSGENPIGKLPFVNLAGDQDNGFWAEGGSDLVDAGIKINNMVTNADHIAVSQGYGQMYMTGKNLPKSVKVGPNHCVQLNQEEGEPNPQIGYLQASPPLDMLLKQTEMAVALMLTTNNLSTSSFATSLQTGGKNLASGVALLIDGSESTEDIDEQAALFIEKEPEMWVITAEWFEVYQSQNLLTEKFQSAVIPDPDELAEMHPDFPSPKPILSEADELAVIKTRQELGLNTQLELIMRDQPGLTMEEAQAKLDEIKAEKKANAAEVIAQSAGGVNANGNQSQASGGNQGQNNFPNKLNQGAQDNGSGQGKN